jgi:hypothetical protein
MGAKVTKKERKNGENLILDTRFYKIRNVYNFFTLLNAMRSQLSCDFKIINTNGNILLKPKWAKNLHLCGEI